MPVSVRAHPLSRSVILKKCCATRAGFRGLTPGGHKKASQDFLSFKFHLKVDDGEFDNTDLSAVGFSFF